ncbi:indole-3-glycerol phosphate synthase TrpC [Brevibacillus daliensis]|uniref:indole-3-glycerol phosphate synthase TrpC n=1 Tax=Brevibacillus daliensis TaxID=2892995 RepID=UPI001E35654B|nr:indole-3-glycerol phosphate synthase TrpC [Brevibacillus daliensis]
MLRKIVEQKKIEVQHLYNTTSTQSMLREIVHQSDCRGFVDALLTSNRPVSLIAEVKKASPSKGLIRPDFDPVAIALDYSAVQADAISVLTDRQFFQGNLSYLQAIRDAIEQPLLRKDFIIDDIQIVEARLSGADAILLIAAILEPAQLQHLYQSAKGLGLDVLIEIHNQRELAQVLSVVKPELLGINNRNLHTFQTDIQTTAELMPLVPSGIPVVSESGLSSYEDVVHVRQVGARSVLVGEQFMRKQNIREAVQSFLRENDPLSNVQISGSFASGDIR